MLETCGWVVGPSAGFRILASHRQRQNCGLPTRSQHMAIWNVGVQGHNEETTVKGFRFGGCIKFCRICTPLWIYTGGGLNPLASLSTPINVGIYGWQLQHALVVDFCENVSDVWWSNCWLYFLQLILQFYNETYTERLGSFDDYTLMFLWSLTTALALPGGMIGAYVAGYIADSVGRYRD